MTDPDIQFKLLIPSELKARLDAAAQKSRRSISGEIVARLEETFRQGFGDPGRLTEAEREEIWEWMQEREKAEIAANITPEGLNFEHAAFFLGVDKKQFARLWKSGLLPASKSLGGMPLWDIVELRTVEDKIINGEIDIGHSDSTRPEGLDASNDD